MVAKGVSFDGGSLTVGAAAVWRPRPSSLLGPPTPRWANVGRRIGHLLANVLGGTGKKMWNLVTLTQHGANSPQMRGFEREIASRIRGASDDWRVVVWDRGMQEFEALDSGLTDFLAGLASGDVAPREFPEDLLPCDDLFQPDGKWPAPD